MFGLVVRVEGAASPGELRTFFANADLGLRLVADDGPSLGVAVDSGNWWFRRDGHALVVVPFGPADGRDLAPDTPYRLVPRNSARDATWQVRDDLRVVRGR